MTRARVVSPRRFWVAGLALAALASAACLPVGETTRPTATPGPASPTAPPMLKIVTPTPGTGKPAARSTPTHAPATTSQPGTYVVQPGDSLYTIALKFHVDVQALMQANSMSDPNQLQAGRVLVIPKTQNGGP